jgi:hypothetical protein
MRAINPYASNKLSGFSASSDWLPADHGFASGQKPGARSSLPLALFVFRDDADHPHYTLAVDDLALVANFLYRCSYFHKPSLQLAAFHCQQNL